jgi:hypothetical protein
MALLHDMLQQMANIFIVITPIAILVSCHMSEDTYIQATPAQIHIRQKRPKTHAYPAKPAQNSRISGKTGPKHTHIGKLAPKHTHIGQNRPETHAYRAKSGPKHTRIRQNRFKSHAYQAKPALTVANPPSERLLQVPAHYGRAEAERRSKPARPAAVEGGGRRRRKPGSHIKVKLSRRLEDLAQPRC